MAKITRRVVEAAAPTGERFMVWDAEIKGFGLLVLASGVRSYVYRYRSPEGRERQVTIAKADACTPDEARKVADGYRAAVREGRDPLAAKQARRNAMTLAELLDAYLLAAPYLAKAATTKVTDKGRIERHLKPLLGRIFVHALRPEDVRRAHADILAGKTAGTFKMGHRGLARVTGGPATARDTIVLLRAVLNWAQAEGLATGPNPAAGIKLGSSRRRELILDDAQAYGRLFKALDVMVREKRLRAPVGDAVAVIALTGARKSEIAALTWQYVDLKGQRIVLPADHHKTGRATGEGRVIALPAAAQVIIARQPAGKPEDFVFRPAGGAGGCISLSKPWRSIRTEAKLPDGIGLHGLRHALGSHMAMNGAGAPEIMAQLGHRQMSTVVRYLHWAADARLNLAERAAGTALAGLQIASGKPGGKVKSLRKRAR